MTGGQDAVGKMRVPQIVAELLAEGVKQIIITSDNPKASRRAFGRTRLPRGVAIRHRDDLITVQEELAKISGVTIMIHEQECATELRRKRKRGLVQTPKKRIMINERVCEGCGDCGDCGDKSNCLSVQPVESEFGRKTQIHQPSCNLDFPCIKGDCPCFVEVTPGKQEPHAPQSAKQTPLIETTSLPQPTRLVGTHDFTMRLTGVGGTGVVTVAQVLAAAAAHAGLKVAGLDQLGLAQKGGAVVSDVRFSTSEIVGSNKIGPGGCDLYLGCDVLVAAAQSNLAVMAPERTYAVVSTSVTPTGTMVTDTTVSFPERHELINRIEWSGHRPENVFVDARAEVAAALGDDQYANVFLLGVALQSGLLPLAPSDVEWALDLNGVKVEQNIQAFRLGRKHVVEAASLETIGPPADTTGNEHPGAQIASIVHAAQEGSLGGVVARRVEELMAYQSSSYARRYAEEVESLRVAEAAALDGASDITEEFAHQLFKVMAYKDEYEVARLQTDPAFEASLREQFGAGARYSILLLPPILRAIGLKQKIRLQAWWATPMLRLLYMLRLLRGTKLDPFGYAKVRRAERALIADYLDAMHLAASELCPENASLVSELAALPEWVRGYEDIKLRSLMRYYSRRSEIIQALRTASADLSIRMGRAD